MRATSTRLAVMHHSAEGKCHGNGNPLGNSSFALRSLRKRSTHLLDRRSDGAWRDLCAARGARLICRAMRHMRCKRTRFRAWRTQLTHDELH